MGFRRKTYGMVKPVKQAKPKPLSKPSVVAYKRLLTAMKKQQIFRTVELLVHCAQWWRNATPWIQEQFKGKQSLESAKALIASGEHYAKAVNAKTDKEKLDQYVLYLAKMQRYASGVIKVPGASTYILQSKAYTKTKKDINKKLNSKFDPLLAQIREALELDIVLAVVDNMKDFTDGEELDFKFDQTQKTVYYSRAYVTKMKKQLWREGLLSLIVTELPFLAKYHAQSIGVDGADRHVLMARMAKFVMYCMHNPNAPKRLVKPQYEKQPSERKKLKDKILAEAQASIKD